MASVTIERVVEWPDTDAAGHYHHSVVLRWVEAAEAELLERLGLLNLYGRIPRVRYEVDFESRLWFRDRVDITLYVTDVGRSSLTYKFTVTRQEEVAALGRLVCAHSNPQDSGSTPWPDEVRAKLISEQSTIPSRSRMHVK